MKIIKYKKDKGNIYKVITEDGEYKLYDDIIINHSLLLKKEITKNEFNKIIAENNLLKAYYDSLKSINTKMRCEKEIREILRKKEYSASDIAITIEKLKKDGYLNSKVYIEAYIHDRLALYTEGEQKILKDLINLGFKEGEIKPFLEKIDKDIYTAKIEKYIDKKLKANKKSSKEFKRKMLGELIIKGFNKIDIINYLENLEIKENPNEIAKIINKLYNKYINKYDLYTTKVKIREYLYRKGYENIDIDEYIKKIP